MATRGRPMTCGLCPCPICLPHTPRNASAKHESNDEREVYQYQHADNENASGIKFRFQNCKRRFGSLIVDRDFGLQRISHSIFLRVLYGHVTDEKFVAGRAGVGIGLAGHCVFVVGCFIKRENHALGCRPIPGIVRSPNLPHPQSAGKSDQEDQNEPKHTPYHVQHGVLLAYFMP